MSYQEQAYSWLFSSNPLLGAQAVSPDGSTFTTFLGEPFTLPKNAFGIEVACIQASVWFTQYNVTADNNRFEFLATGSPTPETLTIAPGLYTFDDLNNLLKQQLLDNYGIRNYNLVAVQSTQRVSEEFTDGAPDSQVYETRWPVGTFGDVLGFFPTRVTDNVSLTPNVYPGDKTARFNAIDFYLVQSSLVNRGIRSNGTFRSVVAQVPITDLPGSQIIYSPINPQWTAAPELNNGAVTSVQTILSDSNGRAVNTQGETYTVTLMVKWKVPLY
jgi:hypothetical protein